MSGEQRARTPRHQILATVAAGLWAGGLTGAGVGLQWYDPAVAVALGAAIGLGVGLRVRALRQRQ